MPYILYSIVASEVLTVSRSTCMYAQSGTYLAISAVLLVTLYEPLFHYTVYIHVCFNERGEGMKKEVSKVKQTTRQSKATQHTQGSHFS